MKKDRDYTRGFAKRENDQLIDFRRKNIHLNQVEHYKRFSPLYDFWIPAIALLICFGIVALIWCNLDALEAVLGG